MKSLKLLRQENCEYEYIGRNGKSEKRTGLKLTVEKKNPGVFEVLIPYNPGKILDVEEESSSFYNASEGSSITFPGYPNFNGKIDRRNNVKLEQYNLLVSRS